jgi:hypothetical protein
MPANGTRRCFLSVRSVEVINCLPSDSRSDRQLRNEIWRHWTPYFLSYSKLCDIMEQNSTWRMTPSGMWRRVDHVKTDASEERITSIIRVWLWGLILFTLIMEEIRSSGTSVLTRFTWRHIPEDGILHSHRRESLKSWTTVLVRTRSWIVVVEKQENFHSSAMAQGDWSAQLGQLATRFDPRFLGLSLWYKMMSQRLRPRLLFTITLCKIWGFQGGDYEEWCLLGCYAVWLF